MRKDAITPVQRRKDLCANGLCAELNVERRMVEEPRIGVRSQKMHIYTSGMFLLLRPMHLAWSHLEQESLLPDISICCVLRVASRKGFLTIES